MNILAVDTSGPICGVAIMQDGIVLSENTVLNKKTHSANLLPMIDSALMSANMELRDINRIAVVTGPGSFTGVRIGVSTVKGLAQGLDIPCVEIDALETIAVSAGDFDGIICPIQDARAGQVYGAAFSGHERLMEDVPLKLEDYLEKISDFGSRFLFAGDGMNVHRRKIAEIMGEKAVFPKPHLSCIRPGAAAYLASLMPEEMEKTEFSLMPMYLRAPSAERNRALVEAANGK